MSRTIRQRAKQNRRLRRKEIKYLEEGRFGGEKAKRIEFYWEYYDKVHIHRDGNSGYGILKKLVKEASRKGVRSAARQEIHHLKKDPEYITRPHEYEHRGEIWNWD